MFIACEESSSDSSSGGSGDVQTDFIVESLPVDDAVLAGITPDAYRPHHGTFSIAVNEAPEGTYKIAARSSDQPAPTATELTSKSAVYERALSSTAINMFVSVHIDGTLFDTGATQDFATAKATLLQPETSYTLYAVKADGTGEVYTLLTFSTTALSTDAGTNSIYGWPSNKYVYTVKAGDPWLVYNIYRGTNGVSININTSFLTTGYDMFAPANPSNFRPRSSDTGIGTDKYILLWQEGFVKKASSGDTDEYAITDNADTKVVMWSRFRFQ